MPTRAERAGSLRENIELLQYEWLPVHGRDFSVQYDTASLNGVTMESATFYSTAGRVPQTAAPV